MHKKVTKRKSEKPASTKNIIGILLSDGIGLLTLLLSTVLVSLILTKSSEIPKSIGVLFIACSMLGAIITGFLASKKCSFKGIISGLVASIPYSFSITIVMLVFSQGRLSTNTLILYLGIFICSALGGIFSANTKRRK